MIDFANLFENILPFLTTSLGMLSFLLFYILWVIFLLPGIWPSMVAGLVYGSVLGTLIVLLGASLGAIISFIFGRIFFSSWVQKKMIAFPKLQAIEKSVSNEGFKFIILTRLSPVFPFSLLNYVYGISDVKFFDYTLGLIGIIPGTFLYCSLGSLAADISLFDSVLSNRTTNLNSFILSFISFLATVALVLLVTKSAKKALQDLDSSNSS